MHYQYKLRDQKTYTLLVFFSFTKQVEIEKTIICCSVFIPYYTYAEILKVKTQQEKVSALYIYIYLFITKQKKKKKRNIQKHCRIFFKEQKKKNMQQSKHLMFYKLLHMQKLKASLHEALNNMLKLGRQ